MMTGTTPSKTVAGRGVAGAQLIGRTLAVLELFRKHSQDLGISEISAELSLSASTVHRIVRALTAERYLAQNRLTERYYLGRSAVLLGQAASDRLGLHRVQAILDRVRDETGESVNLGIREGDEMVVVIRAQSNHPFRFSQEPGSRLPVYATAMGKASLANGPSTISDELDALEKPLKALSKKTITSVEVLRRELEKTKARGYSIDDAEALGGVRCIAAPVLDFEDRLLAAVAIQGPAVRMPLSRLAALAPLISDLAQEVAEVIPPRHNF